MTCWHPLKTVAKHVKQALDCFFAQYTRLHSWHWKANNGGRREIISILNIFSSRIPSQLEVLLTAWWGIKARIVETVREQLREVAFFLFLPLSVFQGLALAWVIYIIHQYHREGRNALYNFRIVGNYFTLSQVLSITLIDGTCDISHNNKEIIVWQVAWWCSG